MRPAVFAQALEVCPGDTALQVFVERVNKLRTTPPPDAWDGTWIMETQ